MLDGDIVVSKLELYLCYPIHFWTDILRKGMNSLFFNLLPSCGLNSTTTVLFAQLAWAVEYIDCVSA